MMENEIVVGQKINKHGPVLINTNLVKYVKKFICDIFPTLDPLMARFANLGESSKLFAEPHSMKTGGFWSGFAPPEGKNLKNCQSQL